MTDKKTVWGDALPHLSFEELKDLIATAEEVLIRREGIAKAEAWTALEQAFNNYTRQFGDIKFINRNGSTILLPHSSNLCNVGVIDDSSDW